ncbi:MAG: NADH dehydrogenase [uncultured Thermomicrobiales bacterium]|uniref:NADH:ubiquinone reductase (non-electrogenic) n=1 Tax=uncultured Thermomicrobiales bacterium TaxID=1645740 RepID=A0A6J4VPQ2_9BACT|nr:MAG: NADH dehydrogenase [uncultured Thermomicrobiales bacterium]
MATAVLSPSDIAQPIRGILRRQKNVRVLMANVVDVDLDRQAVILDQGELPFDYLIVAAGSSHAYFGNDQWEPFAPGLKTLEDALDIRSRILHAFEEAEKTDDPERRRALLTFIVVGGGPTGVELAGSIAEIAHHAMGREFDRIDPTSARIILVEALDRVLPPFLEASSAKALAALHELGVETRFGKPVTHIEPGLVRIGDEDIPAETVLWAAGVKAAPIGQNLGAETDRAGRVKVNPDLSVPGRPNIFVAGDLAALLQPNGKPVPGVAPAAKQQGRHAATNVARLVRGGPPVRFRYRDKGNLAIIGRNKAVAQIGRLRFGGTLAWLAWLTVHLAYLNGFRNRLMAVIDWFLMYLTFRRSVRLISGLRNRPDAGSREAVAVARTAVAPSVETGSGETVPEAATEPEAATVPAATSRTWA